MKLLKLALSTAFVTMALGALFYSIASSGLIGIPGFGNQPSDIPATPVVTPKPDNPTNPTKRPMDSDALYTRIAYGRDYALQVRKETLENYDKRNSKSDPWYEDGRIAADLYACALAGGDPYGEGLLHNADAYASSAYNLGSRDPLIRAICPSFTYLQTNVHNIIPAPALQQLEDFRELASSNYPDILKLHFATAGLKNALGFSDPQNRRSWKEDMTPALGNVQEFFDIALNLLAELIKSGASGPAIVLSFDTLLDTFSDNPGLMEQVNQRFDSIAPPSTTPANLYAVLRGMFLTDWAWTARGRGWADSVTEEGWRQMRERLQKAKDVLEKSEDEFPDDPAIPTALLAVELGQGVGRYRMERLFQNAVSADPGYVPAYRRKIHYLQPRWHGSPKDVLEFGNNCVNASAFSDLIPLVYPPALALMAEQQPLLLDEPQLWQQILAIYEPFLKTYPDSTYHRTEFFEWAVKTKNWDTARAQLQALGTNWHRTVLTKREFDALVAAIPPTT